MTLLLMRSPVVLAQSSPLTEGAARIFIVGREASEGIARTFEPLWTSVLQGSLYTAAADVGALVAVLALGLFLVQWGQQLLSEGERNALPQLIWPLLVILLLNNDGALLRATILDIRGIGNQVNNTILDSTVADVSLQQEYQQTRLDTAIEEVLSTSVAECIENRPESQQAACIETAQAEANRLRQQYGLEPAQEYSWLGGTIQFLVRNLLWLMHSAFQWAVELVLLITALLAPVALGLSLLPTPARPIIAWISGFAGVFLTKLNFNLISGLAAYAVSLQEFNSTSLLLPALLGLFAPILAIVVGLQGGSTLFNALSSVALYTGGRWALYRGAYVFTATTRQLLRLARRR